MWNFMRIVCSTVLIFGFLISCNVAALDPTPPAPLQISNDHLYLQDFNSLQAEENNNNNINNIPFPPAAMQGWWANKPTYGLSNGSMAAGGLFSFGVDDDDADHHHQTNDRSLGSLTSGQVRHISYGVVFSLPSNVDDANQIGAWLVNISFWAEQWSMGGSNRPHRVRFDYSMLTQEQYLNEQGWGYYDTPESCGTWRTIPQLCVESIVVESSPPRPLNGKHPANRKFISHALAVDSWTTTNLLQIRWTHRDASGRDDALAIDDLAISLLPFASLQQIEPLAPSSSSSSSSSSNLWLAPVLGALAMLLLLIVLGIFLWKRDRKGRAARRDRIPLKDYSPAQDVGSSGRDEEDEDDDDEEELLGGRGDDGDEARPLMEGPPGLYKLWSMHNIITGKAPEVEGTMEHPSFGRLEEGEGGRGKDIPEDEAAEKEHHHGESCKKCRLCGKTKEQKQ